MNEPFTVMLDMLVRVVVLKAIELAMWGVTLYGVGVALFFTLRSWPERKSR